MITNLKQYRFFDMTLLTLLAVVTEVMGDLLHKRLPGAGFFLSFSILITIIAIVRWGKIGSLVYVIAGLPMIYLGPNGFIENILLYPVANGIIVVMALLVTKVDVAEVVRDNLKLLLAVTLTFVALALGKGLVLVMLGDVFLSATVMYFLANLFGLVMTYIVLLLIRNRPGLLIAMETYFKQTEEMQ